MAIVDRDGFDGFNGVGTNTGLQAKWITGGTISMQTGRFGGQCMRTTAAVEVGGQHATRNLPAGYSSLTVGFAFRAVALPTSDSVTGFMTLLSSGSYHVGARLTTAGAIEIGRYTSGTASTVLGTTANGVIVVNTWHFLEFEIVISDTAGRVDIYRDGASVSAFGSSLDTRNGTPTTADQLQFGILTTANPSPYGTLEFDDLYVLDVATRLGERRIETLRPTVDSGTNQWTPSTGTDHYAVVDEATANGDTDYLSTSTVNNRELFGNGGLSSTPATIDEVTVVMFAEKTDATTRTLYGSVQSGATDSDGSALTLAASYGHHSRAMALNPNGSVAWTASAVNNLKFGPKLAA